ncbi:MAG: hypothetical protein H7263_02370 [Candidatus Sericytochromatia bacterium]|nr:hypothetical protein [Candidatus Sericytochromatia bacterium]
MNLSSIEALTILQKSTNKLEHRVLFLPEFEQDALQLDEKFKTIGNDLMVFIDVGLKLYHDLNLENDSIKLLKDLKIKNAKVYETVKFACRSLKGKGANSGIKIVYAHFEDEKRIELIEIYYKDDKENIDRKRILKYYN